MTRPQPRVKGRSYPKTIALLYRAGIEPRGIADGGISIKGLYCVDGTVRRWKIPMSTRNHILATYRAEDRARVRFDFVSFRVVKIEAAA